MKSKFDLAILIPTFHEEKNIYAFYKAFSMQKFNFKIFFCFVDDSKNNLTKEKIEKYFTNFDYKILKFNKIDEISTRCKSSWNGFIWLTKNIDCKYIAEMDIDLAQHPKDLNRGYYDLVNFNADVVIFSKYLIKSKNEGRSILRSTISFLYSKICRVFFSNNITDYSNSYRIYKTSALKSLLITERTFDTPIQHLENILFFLKNNYFIIETHCHYAERIGTQSTIKTKHLLTYTKQFLICVLKNL